MDQFVKNLKSARDCDSAIEQVEGLLNSLLERTKINGPTLTEKKIILSYSIRLSDLILRKEQLSGSSKSN